MHVAAGKSIQVGQVAIGPLRFCKQEQRELPAQSVLSRTWELERLDRARARAVRELTDLCLLAEQTVDRRTASIFSIHAMLLQDDELMVRAQELISRDGMTAEYAAQTAGNAVAAAFAGLPSAYMRARAMDFRDITQRMVRILAGEPPQELLGGQSAILVADEFLPSEVFTLDRRHLLGFVSRRGSADSHAAQIFRAMKVPALVEVGDALEPAWDGRVALLDSHEGKLYIDPDRALTERLRLRYQGGNGPRAAAQSREEEPHPNR